MMKRMLGRGAAPASAGSSMIPINSRIMRIIKRQPSPPGPPRQFDLQSQQVEKGVLIH
jgi:hypothetical protein